MKPLVIFAILALFPYSLLFGQESVNAVEKTKMPLLYLGVGLGVNEYGIGLDLEIPIIRKLSIKGNLGIGGWGWKAGGSLNFYPKNVMDKSEFSIGYSKASGIENVVRSLWLDPDEKEYPVKLAFNPVETINLVYTINVKIKKASKAGFSLGYALPITKNPYSVKSNVDISRNSEQYLKIYQPGGLIIGMKIALGAL